MVKGTTDCACPGAAGAGAIANDPRAFVVLGNPGSRRVDLFQEALARLELSPALLLSWADLLAGRAALPDVVAPGSVVRIESPDRDFEVERALLAAGAEAPDTPAYARAGRAEVAALAFERGRIWWPRQWYLGFRWALSQVEAQLAACPTHRRMGSPSEIAVMFDKAECHRRLQDAGVALPRALGQVTSFEELRARMRAAGCARVFAKLSHGSSASGAVAYRTDGRRHQAMTTVEMVPAEDGMHLYNSRRVRVHEDERDIGALVDALAPHGLHVEEWIPKAGLAGRTLDLRVVVIAGRPRHVAVRLSRTPMTNLHLLNDRGDAGAVRERLGEARWAAAMETCARAGACFPASLHVGVDLLISSDFQGHAVLEANAFGDLLPGILDGGDDTYTAEIRSVGERRRA